MRRHYRRRVRMTQKIALIVLHRVRDAIRHGLAGRVQLRLGHAGRIAHDGVSGLTAGGHRLCQKLVSVGLAGGGIELKSHTPRGVIRAVTQRQYRENHQGCDLNHVDGDINGRRTVYAAAGDIGHPEGERHRDDHHECDPRIGGAHHVRPKGSGQITAQDAHHAHHHARVNPVIQVRAPADDEFRKARIAPRFVVIQKRLFREVVRTAGAGIQLGHLRVANGRRKAEQKGDHDAHPHSRPRGSGGCLNVKGEPEKGARRDERHGVHRQSG
jgi:hypothetical protein